MPLILFEKISSDISMNAWKLEETIEDLRKNVILDYEEEDYFKSFGNEKRKKQWLGYRILLQHLLETRSLRIRYDDYGKPVLQDSDCRFSVSHSGDYAAAIINRRDDVGIDIEKIRERIERVKERFLSVEELKFINNEYRLEKLHVCWGAKESLYKLHGKPDVDLRTDIVLEQFDYLCIGKGNLGATMIASGNPGCFTIHYQRIEDYMLVYAVST